MMTRRALLIAPLALAAQSRKPGLAIAKDSFAVRRFTNTLDLLEHCHALGAAGIQATLSSLEPDFLRKLRGAAGEYGMYLELQTGLPKQDTAAFERQVAAAKELGARSIRTACLGGRRYETFSTLEEFRKFDSESRRWIEQALRIVEKHRIPLAIENHKDRTADELAALLKSYSSEYLGVCLDTGNNISLLDDPVEVVRVLAPYAITTHIKDMAVEEYADGFLLSEVPLGRGMLNSKQIVGTILAARPKADITLEMITRDPLKIPCLTEKYWATFPDRNGRHLANTLTSVRKHASKCPQLSGLSQQERLQREEENIKECLAYYREHIA